MIVYDLACAQEHRFEGWFASAEDYAQQRERALLRCPLCDDDVIERRPSANVQVGRASAPVQAQATAKAETSTPKPNDVQADMLRMMRTMIEKSVDVGTAFPEEARKMHYDEAPARSIRGRASPEETDALRDEGIDVLSLPAILTRNLQ